MSRPGLQVALDQRDLAQALQAASVLLPHVDIIEAGTILCLNQGVAALRALRSRCPDKTLVADWKVADAGDLLASQALEAGADWMTVICAAPLATVEKAHQAAQARGGEIQIELFGHWTMEDARAWRRIGIRQAIYHRGRDAQAGGQQWGEDDLTRMAQLSDLGLQVSVTGGIRPEDLIYFRQIKVKAFIAGRALYGAADPRLAAQAFQQQIQAIWGGEG
ncbi:3-keto-L-gulonate-6-phosphate decarboxylase UlaD [Edwardsiella anguillarum]|uniref:3-keto-L-gulonate-6-phosphate decarboxylase UlaD n=1 Tax=Edwardsiella anguillarum TaxID=1821960 RepID=UPI0024B6AAD5|nr:3-keto-L-gulonate-6-phosphate decarboxylase UlaD [Edwardsiella anguillarum]WHP79863.1 3-keto-L-gulonate-6-phosphate decarboxylase UlaD [Edwardsiella anguillarum]WHQ17324.1 3-keto-L-gulonate-6-phosphate decarboxylase UlaD [Edwardsiella anguillarum]WHQ20861.1 3-keto-L-gulonate-6-phosphate decarboxylase UlaD [Edwardsiella anguillarum]WHQ24383.1 3-keto-L-gulonate-6-phosphate decarboxylase UlaD [Edwardsiella anguillarum]WHQ27952.1 3-keto-L-gulonate-6-phosphate decarboxylase UlaD [Edwardsiella an